MTPGARGWLSDSGPEPELTWMVVASTAVHVAAFAVLAFLPREIFSGTPPAVVAYTVKIVDPNALGGRLPQGPIRPDRAPAAARDGARDESKPPAEKKPPPKQEPARPPEEKAVTIPAPPKAEKAAEAKKIAAAKEAEAKALAVKAAIDAKAAAAKAAADAKAAAAKAAADARAAAEARARAEAERAERKQHAEQVASLARDRRIQDAVGKLGRRGTADEAAGLGGTEPGKGAALGTGGDGGGGGVLMGLEFIIYKNQVERTIKQHWTWVGSDPNLTARVGFRIDDAGNILDVHLVQGSRDGTYDDSVLRAIRGSTPLPPPPEKYREVFANYLLDFVSGELAAGG